METNSIQQEILVVLNTSFSQRERLEKEAMKNNKILTPAEQLEEACWNGWLNEMLPEIVDISKEGKSPYLWEIMRARSFIDIELCEFPQTINPEFSINLYAFLIKVGIPLKLTTPFRYKLARYSAGN